MSCQEHELALDMVKEQFNQGAAQPDIEGIDLCLSKAHACNGKSN